RSAPAPRAHRRGHGDPREQGRRPDEEEIVDARRARDPAGDHGQPPRPGARGARSTPDGVPRPRGRGQAPETIEHRGSPPRLKTAPTVRRRPRGTSGRIPGKGVRFRSSGGSVVSRSVIGFAAATVFVVAACGWTVTGSTTGGGSAPPVVTDNPIVFVTQVPIPSDFTNVVSTFGNHLPNPGSCPRGGALWIRYPSGALKNLTRAAGYGTSGLQGPTAIAVREPCVHWSGTKVLFSMLVGAPALHQPPPNPWQL